YAGHRTGGASRAPVLLLTGADDIILYPLLATRLSDAYGMAPVDAPGVRRGPRSTRLHFPGRGHEILTADEARRAAWDFLADGGRHAPKRVPPKAAPQPTAVAR